MTAVGHVTLAKLQVLCCSLVLAMISAQAGAEPLFNGKTLVGWQQTGDVEWSIEQGSISATGSGDGYIFSQEEYADFRLSLEFWVDATTNSGVFVRCQDRDNIHPETCYELNIWDEHPRQEARTGAIVFKVMPPRAQVNTVGRWNTLKVVARATSLTVSINDQVTATLDEALLGEGFIALQHFGQGTVRFRNFRVEEVTATGAASE